MIRFLTLNNLRRLFYLTFCSFSLSSGIFLGWAGKSKVITAISKQAITHKKPEEVFLNRPHLTLLLLGCDEDRAPGGKKILVESARSDTMIVVKFDFQHQRITGISLPRDLMVQLPGYRAHKINAYHKFGGNELAKKAAESVLQISIDKVIDLNTSAMQEMVELVGGVEIYVPKKMKWTDRRGNLYIDLKPGMQKLDGYNAMCFVRYRHGDSDHHRQERQKEFLLAFRNALSKKPALLPVVLDKTIEIAGNQFTPDELAALALFVNRIGNDNIKMGVVPTYVAGYYYLGLDRAALPKVLKEFNLISTDSDQS